MSAQETITFEVFRVWNGEVVCEFGNHQDAYKTAQQFADAQKFSFRVRRVVVTVRRTDLATFHPKL